MEPTVLGWVLEARRSIGVESLIYNLHKNSIS